MYQHILIPLENSATDRGHSRPHQAAGPKLTGAKLLLLHVADGWVARNFNQLKLAESEEMKERPRVSGKSRRASFAREGFAVETMLALGDPPAEIIKVAEGRALRFDCDGRPRPPAVRRLVPRQHHHRSPPPHHHSPARPPCAEKMIRISLFRDRPVDAFEPFPHHVGTDEIALLGGKFVGNLLLKCAGCVSETTHPPASVARRETIPSPRPAATTTIGSSFPSTK